MLWKSPCARRCLQTLVCSLTLLLLVGCPQPAEQTPDGKPKKFRIGMSQCNLGEPWRVQMNADIKAAAEAHADLIEVVFKDAQNDTLTQQRHVEEFISDRMDLIIISPKEAMPLTEPVGRAIDAGIPVIVLDRAIVGDKYTCFIGANNKQIGHAAGRWLASRFPPPQEVKIVELKGLMTSTPGQDRHSGFREAIRDEPRLQVIFEAEMNWLGPNARKEMESALARFERIDAVYAHNDPGAYGAYLAAKAVGREKQIVFIGIDALPHEGQAYVRQGVLDATFEYPTGGKEAIETALKILNRQEVPKKIELKSRLFTKENIDRGGQLLD